MDTVLKIALAVTLIGIVVVLATGVTIFVRGGEANRRLGNRLMNLRTATQGLAILLLGLIYLLHQYG